MAKEKDEARREELIGTLIARMTLDEKLFQMGGGGSLSELLDYGSAPFPAGGCERLGIPPVQFSDGPRGVMLNASTCFPVTMARGATWCPELEERVGAAMGAEARAQGANLSGAVCINLLRHPAWGRAQETYGEDTHLLGEMGAALVRGVQRHVMACVKHFAANSIENARFWVDVSMDDRTLHEVYLPHFKKCVEAGAASVMGAYNRLNGPHCCHSHHLLTDILKTKWGFRGFVISDWTFALRGSDSAAAGLDIEMPNAVFHGLPLKVLVQLHRVPESVVDDAVRRIIRQHARFHGIGKERSFYKNKVGCKEHHKLALEVAQKSMVLLKNDGGLLPLDSQKIRRSAVIGKLADTENIGDRGSSTVKPPHVITPLAGIRSAAGKTTEVIYESSPDPAKVARAARGTDVVIVVAGLTHEQEGEFITLITKGGDRDHLGLDKKQQAMIQAAARANKNCVVVLEGGSAITMEPWVEDVAAILMAWYPGMEGGHALADILFGKVNPSGKLPLTIPRSEAQLVPFNKWARRIRYGYFHGYTHMQKEKLAPRFPFGFGLSYTNYVYDHLQISPTRADASGNVTVTAEITNTGKMAGEEIAQLYVGFPDSKVERPQRALKGFKRITLKPGETKPVVFEIAARDLACYDTETEDWVVEPGKYLVYVGASSRLEDLPLTGSFVMKGHSHQPG